MFHEHDLDGLLAPVRLEVGRGGLVWVGLPPSYPPAPAPLSLSTWVACLFCPRRPAPEGDSAAPVTLEPVKGLAWRSPGPSAPLLL